MHEPDPHPVDTQDPEPVEPRGTEADLAEQIAPVEPIDDEPGGFALPEDPEVPLADAWEASQPVVDDEDEQPHDT